MPSFFENLRVRLLGRGQMVTEPTPGMIAQRLRRALSGRPRLALDDEAERVAREWADVTRPAVAAQAPDLARLLAAQLGCSTIAE